MEPWQNQETIALWIIAAAVFFLVLLFFIIFLVKTFFQRMVAEKMRETKVKMEHQKKLLNNTIATQEVERKRIAEDLHDELIGKLMVIKLRQEAIEPANEDMIELVNTSITTARRISHDLSPPLIEFTSLADLLLEMVDNWKLKFDVETNFDVRKNENITNEFKVQFLRIAQETITNIDKHAKAETISFHFRQSHSSVALKIMDDGQGYDINKVRMGLGLKSIETRVQFLKGKYHVESKKGLGTSVLFFFNKF